MHPTNSPADLDRKALAEALVGQGPDPSRLSVDGTAGVLFLIQDLDGNGPTLRLLLTKRSPWVRQPGDLCCPGGRVHHGVDDLLGSVFALPGSPLVGSRGWTAIEAAGAERERRLGLFWACALRESWEEMGLNPWGVEFLGLLPLNNLASFSRGILPLVGWIDGERQFRLNDEVDRVVPIPLAALLEPDKYHVYLIEGDWAGTDSYYRGPSSFPCFVHEDDEGKEVLWGATYRIVTSFLEIVFDFEPPPMARRPVVTGTLDSTYATGRRRGG